LFYAKTLEKFEIIKQQYQIEGAMTLRRIYYVLLGKGLQSPGQAAYQNLSQQLLKAREQGYLPWAVMVDRARRIDQRFTFINFDKAFRWIREEYRKNSMLHQKNYVEVWIEKDAVSSIVVDTTWDLDVPLIVGRGWASGTFIHNATPRISETGGRKKLQVVILYISDLDPEGEHIPRVVERKLKRYGYPYVEVKKIALNFDQVKEFSLQSNIGFKINEKQREKRYVREFLDRYGEVQYELDALSNIELSRILENELKSLIDFDIPKISDEQSRLEVKKWLDEHYKESKE
jgi:hypothetical protein